MPTLLAPLALIGLASLPALAAIYWLRNRYRRRVVSSLMLWAEARQAREGGTRLHRLQTPLLFLLELLALLMLTAAATGPHAPASATAVELTVVLDDSLSMLGPAADRGFESARRQALDAIEDELRTRPYHARFVLAAARPRLLADPTSRPAEAMALLDRWHCRSATADLTAALGLASELASGGASGGGRVLVITDRPPAEPPQSGRIEWRAFGRASSNIAIIGAARAESGDRHRCLIEVANLSSQPATAALTVELADDDPPQADQPTPPLRRWDLDLGPEQTRRLFFTVPSDVPALRARLADDLLEPDNTALLLPPVSRPVHIGLRIADEDLAPLVRRAVEAVPHTVLGGARPTLIITDGDAAPPGRAAWVARFMLEEDARAYIGPFVLDRDHPLTDGLAMSGVIWAAGEQRTLGGWPVIAAGNVVLLADTERPDGRHELRLRYRPDLSTLHGSPNWPILLWNLIRWRADHLPGLDRANVRLGERITLSLDPAEPTEADTEGDEEAPTVTVIDPAGETRQLPVGERRITIPAEMPGLWSVRWGRDREQRFAVNFLDRAESDLRGRTEGRWGDWTDSPAFGWEYRNIGWVFAIIAAALLSAHLALVARLSGGGPPDPDADADGEGRQRV